MSEHPGGRTVGTGRVGTGRLARLGALLFALWGVLHLWVGVEGLHQFVSSPAQEQWRMFLGGSEAPPEAFSFPTDAVTARVHANLVLNLCLDIAGYGLLSLFVAWAVYRRASWIAYLLGLIVVGVCDLSFAFLQLIPGIIEPSLPTVSGPIVWLLAVVITPFGLPAPRRSAT